MIQETVPVVPIRTRSFTIVLMMASSAYRVCGLVALSLATAGGSGSAPGGEAPVGPTADLEAIQNAFEALARKVSPTVVTIKCTRPAREPLVRREGLSEPQGPRLPGRRTYGAGSGVIIRADGMILTNEHVVQQSEEILVGLHDGRKFTAAIVQSDRRSDLAVLRIDATGLRAAVLGDASDLRQGHLVFPMGNPFGVASEAGGAAMSWGVVSALGRPLPMLGRVEDRYYGDLIETTASIIPGNSGGPLFDIFGRVVGITTAISTRTGRSGRSEGIGFAVPIGKRTRPIIERLIKGEEAVYGLLGVRVCAPGADDLDRTDDLRRRGALIQAVDAGSPAHKARLRPGDLIVTFDGRDVLDDDDLVRMVGSTPPGRAVEIVFYRGKKRRMVSTPLARRSTPRHHRVEPVQWRGLTLAPVGSATRPNANPTTKPDRPLRGLIVIDVRPNSQAERAGVQPGMVLDRVGEEPVATIRELRRRVSQVQGLPVEITIGGGRRFQLPPD